MKKKNEDLWIEGRDLLDDPGPKVVRFSQQPDRFIRCPWALLVDACSLTKGHGQLTVALVAQLIYRRTQVCKSRTVTLPAVELKELGINRFRKMRTLRLLQAGGPVTVEKHSGRSPLVTLLWKPKRRRI
jgi:hypothetical protein